jgi:hypothetical protein
MSQVANLSQPAATAPKPSFRFAAALWWFMLISCLGVVGYATRFFISAPPNSHFARYILPVRLHIAGGMGALLAGPWQFSQKLRTRALDIHRWLGRFYLLSVALGSIAGFVMAIVSMEGLPPISASALSPSCGSSPRCKPIASSAAAISKLTAVG